MAGSANAQEDDPQRPVYFLDVTLNLGNQQASVQQAVHYVNRSSMPLSKLVFQVPPARYDAFALSDASAGGQAVTPTLEGEVLSVPLNSDLDIGASITATLAYSLTIPSPGDIRYGYLAGVVAMGNWFPILALTNDQGWVKQQYVAIGDPWVAETADYRVTLTLDREAKVAHTGRLVSADGTRFTIEANNVRDFALAVSERYLTVQQQVGDVQVTVFYLPEQGENGPALLRYTAETVEWGAQVLGGYPYSTLHAAVVGSNDPAGVGQEYPTLYFISNQVASGTSTPGSYFNYIATHETLHQWFYSQVGVDQVNEPWIDEGLAVMLTYEFYEDRYPYLYESSVAGLRSRLSEALSQYGEKPLNTPIQDYADEAHYFAILYRRATVFYLEVEALIGETNFFGALSEVIAQSNEPRLVSGDQVLAAFAQYATAEDFRDLVRRYFRFEQERLPVPTFIPNTSPGTQPEVATPEPTPSILAEIQPLPTTSLTAELLAVPSVDRSDSPPETPPASSTATAAILVPATATESAAPTRMRSAVQPAPSATSTEILPGPSLLDYADLSSPPTLGVAVVIAFVVGFGATALYARIR